MRTGLRVKRDIEARRMAAELFEQGHGHRSTAKALRIPRQTVKQWRRIYRALGSEAPPTMDGEQARHTHERKVASAAVDGGATKAEAMAGLGIVHRAPLERWRRPCREGGAEAAAAPRSDGHGLGHLLARPGPARSTYCYAPAHPAGPAGPELRGAVAEIFSRTANGCGHRRVAMCLRAELGARIAGKTALRMMREMGIRCGIRRETDRHRHNSYRGVVGEAFGNAIGRDFAAEGPWRKMGTDVTEFRQPRGKAYFAPVYDSGGKGIVAWSTSASSLHGAAA